MIEKWLKKLLYNHKMYHYATNKNEYNLVVYEAFNIIYIYA